MKLHLKVEAMGSDDMDLFVAIQKVDQAGALVPFVFYAMLENGPVALGWLRVSHRELDPARSTPEQPVHTHTREQLLQPGERVAVDIEIWPSSTLFRQGERLRLVIQGQDIYRAGLPNAPFARHEKTRNRGTHVIYTGVADPSVPAVESRDADASGRAADPRGADAGARDADARRADARASGADARGASSGGAMPSHLLIPVIPPSNLC
jgi:hypothetical protein